MVETNRGHVLGPRARYVAGPAALKQFQHYRVGDVVDGKSAAHVEHAIALVGCFHKRRDCRAYHSGAGVESVKPDLRVDRDAGVACAGPRYVGGKRRLSAANVTWTGAGDTSIAI